MPWSAQKSSAQTEQRDVQASQPQWSCRQITRLAGGRPQCGHASNQADSPLRDRCPLKVARRPCADSSCHSARCIRTLASTSCNGCTTAFTWLRRTSSVRRRSASAVTVAIDSGSDCSLRIDSKYRSNRPSSAASACSAAARRAATRSADFSWRWLKSRRSKSPGSRAGTGPASAATDSSAGSIRPASRSRNAPARSSSSFVPADRSNTSLSTTASSTPPPARSTTRATSRPTGCTATSVLGAFATPSRTGIVSSTPSFPLARPSSPPVPLSLRERGDEADAGAISPSDRRAARARIAWISCSRKGLPSTAISAPGSRSRASGDACAGCCAVACGADCVSCGVRGDVHQHEGQSIDLRDQRDGASGAGQAGEPDELPVFGMTTGRLRRDAPPSDRLDRLERLQHVFHVQAEPEALCVPAGRLDDLARAEAEAQAARDRHRAEPALEPHGVVVRRDQGVERLLLLAHRAALLDVGGEPLFGQPALELLGAAEFAEDQVQLAHHQLEQLDLLVEQLEDVRLDRSRRGEVHNVDFALLPDAVQPSDALLHHHRVPGQIVVHQHVAELQIASFAAGAGGDQHAAL